MAFKWTCMYCRHPQVANESTAQNGWDSVYIGENALGDVGVGWSAVACQNDSCKKVTLSFRLTKRLRDGGGTWREKSAIERWHVLPASSALPQPDYIPSPLIEDYTEACKIRDLSPKASATLARRCLQGMIRDFCKIAKGRLIDEIKELRTQVEAGTAPRGVTPESVDAIDAVRNVGNIGAHMEKDINAIVDIDPSEAQMLIELVEMLFDEWYVEQHNRSAKLAAIKTLSEQKKLEIEKARLLAGKKPDLG